MQSGMIAPSFDESDTGKVYKAYPESVFLSEETLACQSYLLEMIKVTLRELVQMNPIFDNDEFSLETALTNAFNQLANLYIDPVWHQLSQTSHRLFADVAGLRRLLFRLIDSDAVTFLDNLESLRQAELSAVRNTGVHETTLRQRIGGACANWLLMDEAEKLLSTARKRVYSCYEKRTYSVELCPKLSALREVLQSIKVQSSCSSDSPETVLILVGHSRTAELIEIFLNEGKNHLNSWLIDDRKLFEHDIETRELPKEFKISEFKQSVPPSPTRPLFHSHSYCTRKRRGAFRVISCSGLHPVVTTAETSANLKMSAAVVPKLLPEAVCEIPSFQKEGIDDLIETAHPSLHLETSIDMPPGCRVLSTSTFGARIVLRVPPPGSREEGAPAAFDLHSLDGPAGCLGVILSRLCPDRIILFEPRIAWVREVEIYVARRVSTSGRLPHPINIHFMVYKNSVEEQRYLTSLRREKEAFENLIKLRSSVVIQKMHSVMPTELNRPVGEADVEPASRISEEPQVLVDVREFRSELPALLHRKGIKVFPLTLSIGDYILAPHICVERKSVNDLICSLNSGRLYQQCVSMARHYLNPVLLIEFSMPANGVRRSYVSGEVVGSFALFTGRNAVLPSGTRMDLGPRHLMSKLVLLTIHFPSLRILWSVTPYCTAELFSELKMGRAEPTSNKLPQAGEHFGEDNVDAVDMLLKMPGISWRNYQRLSLTVDSLYHIADCSLEHLGQLLDNGECAKQLHDFLHFEWTPSVNGGALSDPTSSASDFNSARCIKKPRMGLASRVKKSYGDRQTLKK